MLDILDSKKGLSLKIHPSVRLWEAMYSLVMLVNYIICLVIEIYVSGWTLLLWIVLNTLVLIPLYLVSRKQYNSLKKELLRCIDKCIPYKE